VQGSSGFYRQTGRWPKSRSEIEQGLKGPAKFLRGALVDFRDEGERLLVQFSAEDGVRGTVTVRAPR
jgi:hypothetical protein